MTHLLYWLRKLWQMEQAHSIESKKFTSHKQPTDAAFAPASFSR